MKTTPLFYPLILLLYFLLFGPAAKLPAQNILVTTGATNNTIVSVNLLTCEQTPVTPGLSMQINDFWMMPDGTIYITGYSQNAPFNGQMYKYDPVTGTAILLFNSPVGGGGALFGLNDSTLLWQQFSNFYTYNINQNSLTLLGTQSGFNGYSEIFTYNGNLYINASSGVIYQIQLTPTFSLQPASLFPNPIGPLVGVCNKLFGHTTGHFVKLGDFLQLSV